MEQFCLLEKLKNWLHKEYLNVEKRKICDDERIYKCDLFLLFGCTSSTKSNREYGNYICSMYDSSDVKFAQGWIYFEISDSNEVKGNWKLKNLRFKSGELLGSGDLSGNKTESVYSLDLHPNFRDNNIFLVFHLNNNKLDGKWYHSTFVGASNSGKIFGYEYIGE